MRHSFVAKEPTTICELISVNVAGLSKASIITLLKKGEIKLNGAKCLLNTQIKAGDEVSVFIPKKYLNDCRVEYLYVDKNIVVVFKPALCDVENNLLSIVKERFDCVKAVHRLDRNTQGLVVFALNDLSLKCLNSAFKDRLIDKYYYALVMGECNLNGEYKAYLTKDKNNSCVKIYNDYVKGSKQIVTGFSCVKKFNNRTLLQVKLITGRTHQIRAHLAYLGYPIFGDNKYGLSKNGALKLVAYKMAFNRLNGVLEYLNGKEFAICVDIDAFCAI